MKIMRNQKGFTLIELVIVIIILGILAAVAIPKIANLTSYAEQAVVKGLSGALRTAATIAYAQANLAQPPVAMIITHVYNNLDETGGLTIAGANWFRAVINGTTYTWTWTSPVKITP